MLWQDWVLTIGSIALVISLLPSVFSQHKPALFTSSLTGTVIITFIIVYASLGLWFAAAVNTVNSFLWLVLAFQKFMEHRVEKSSNINN